MSEQAEGKNRPKLIGAVIDVEFCARWHAARV